MTLAHLRTAFLLGALLIATAAGAADAPRKIVLIGGPKSEAPGRHDYANAVRVLDRLLRSSPDLQNVDIHSHPSRWPDDAALDGASTVVWYFDGLDQHPLLEPARRSRFEAHSWRGRLTLVHIRTYTAQHHGWLRVGSQEGGGQPDQARRRFR